MNGLGAFLADTNDQCTARKPDTPQKGERCVLMPHAHWMPHSWVPWPYAVELQGRYRDQHARLGRCDACPEVVA